MASPNAGDSIAFNLRCRPREDDVDLATRKPRE
jgi:hypothetical protein